MTAEYEGGGFSNGAAAPAAVGADNLTSNGQQWELAPNCTSEDIRKTQGGLDSQPYVKWRR